jgi:hypothetical protein
VNRRWLLPAQTLLDLCAEDETAAQRWAQDKDSADIRLDVLSVAQAQAAAAQIDDATARQRLTLVLADLLAKLEADGGAPLPFCALAALQWQALVHERALTGLHQVARQVHAVARAQGLVVVERAHPAHAALAELGFEVEGLPADG